MTPEAKAKELYTKMKRQQRGPGIEAADGNAKRSALICCDEIIAAIDFDWMEVQNLEREHAYWQAVRQHIANQ